MGLGDPPRRLALGGFMGVGKSTVGAALAAAEGLLFVDLDERISMRDGRSIRRIFVEDGEAGFRALERAALEEALEGGEGILALGGGTLHQPACLELLRAAGWPLWILDAPFEELQPRLAASSQRPLAAEAAALYEARRPGYLDAGPQLSVGGRTVEEIVGELRDRLGWRR